MTPRRRRRWSYSAGHYPATVTVEEREIGGPIYARVFNPELKRQVRRSLGHRDQTAAIAFAEREAKKLRDGISAAVPQPTVGYVLGQYLLHRTPKKGVRSADGGHGAQKEDRRRAKMWIRILGESRRIATIGGPEWESFVRDRTAGVIDATGSHVPKKKRTLVGPRTAAMDLVFLIAVFNWACTWMVNGQPLLERNPWGSPGHGIKRSLELPKTVAPLRPVMTFERYQLLRAAADKVWTKCRKTDAGAELVIAGKGARDENGKRTRGGTARLWKRPTHLGEILDLIEQTGRRVSAVRQLCYSDLVRDGDAIAAVRWRSVKGGEEIVLPVSDETRATLTAIVRARPGVGDLPLFPSYRDARKPVKRSVLERWYRQAEAIAELPHLEGGVFHPFRRAWATARKDLPDIDVAKVGGWKSLSTMKSSYQMSDSATVIAVVNHPAKLREKKA